MSVLFATHDLGTAWEICDRVTVMYAGQELETAPIADFFRAPMVPYTRLLLDSLPSSGSPLRGIAGDVPNLIVATERLPLSSALSVRQRCVSRRASGGTRAGASASGALPSSALLEAVVAA